RSLPHPTAFSWLWPAHLLLECSRRHQKCLIHSPRDDAQRSSGRNFDSGRGARSTLCEGAGRITAHSPERRDTCDGGVVFPEGSETIAFFAAFCLFPSAFPILALIFGIICIVSPGSVWAGRCSL